MLMRLAASVEAITTCPSTFPSPVDGPGYWNVDTAVIKRIRFKERLGIELRLEAFNVFNHTNFSVPNTLNLDDTDFGKINAAFDPRILQLSWKFTF